jgi:hypothetical protein
MSRERIENYVLLTFGTFFVFYPIIYQTLSQSLFSHDTLYWFLPFFSLLMDGLARGEIPFLNPYSHAGEGTLIPFVHLCLFSPLTLLTGMTGAWFDIDSVLLAVIDRVVRLSFGGIGVYLFLKFWCTTPWSRVILFSLIFFTAFLLNGFHQNGVTDHFYLSGWILYFSFRLFCQNDLRWHNVVGLSIFFGQSFSSYFFFGPIIAITIFLIFWWLVRRQDSHEAHSLTSLIAKSTTAALLLASASFLNITALRELHDATLPVRDSLLLMPDLGHKVYFDSSIIGEYLTRHTSQLQLAAATGATATTRDAIFLFLPALHRMGIPAFSEVSVALPFLTLPFFLTGIFISRDRYKKLIGSFTIIFLLLSWGYKGGLFTLLVYLPAFSEFRHTEQLFSFFLIGVIYFIMLGYRTFGQARLPDVKSLFVVSGEKNSGSLFSLIAHSHTSVFIVVAAILLTSAILFDNARVVSFFPILLFVTVGLCLTSWLLLRRAPPRALRLIPIIGTAAVLCFYTIQRAMLSAEYSSAFLAWPFTNMGLILSSLTLLAVAELQAFYRTRIGRNAVAKTTRSTNEILRLYRFSSKLCLALFWFGLSLMFLIQITEIAFFINWGYFSEVYETLHDGSRRAEKNQNFFGIAAFWTLVILAYIKVFWNLISTTLRRLHVSWRLFLLLSNTVFISALANYSIFFGVETHGDLIVYLIVIIFLVFCLIRLAPQPKETVTNSYSLTGLLPVTLAVTALAVNLLWLLDLGFGDNRAVQIVSHLYWSRRFFWGMAGAISAPLGLLFILRYRLSFFICVTNAISRISRFASKDGESGLWRRRCGITAFWICLVCFYNFFGLVHSEFSTKILGPLESTHDIRRLSSVDGYLPWQIGYPKIHPQVVRYPELILRQYTAVDTYLNPHYLPYLPDYNNISAYNSQPFFLRSIYKKTLGLVSSQEDRDTVLGVGKPIAQITNNAVVIAPNGNLVSAFAHKGEIAKLRATAFVEMGGDHIHQTDSEQLCSTPSVELPIAALGEDSLESNVDITRPSSNSFAIRNLRNQAGFVLLNLTFSKHWRVSIDGQPAEIFRANGIFMATPVTCEDQIIEFIYDPTFQKIAIGLYLFPPAFGTLLLALFLGNFLIQRLRRLRGAT